MTCKVLRKGSVCMCMCVCIQCSVFVCVCVQSCVVYADMCVMQCVYEWGMCVYVVYMWHMCLWWFMCDLEVYIWFFGSKAQLGSLSSLLTICVGMSTQSLNHPHLEFFILWTV